MKIAHRMQQLKERFTYLREVNMDDTPIEIRPFQFTQRMGEQEINDFQKIIPPADFCSISDNNIPENKSFPYTIFLPKGYKKTDNAILLIHGLNERNWYKYLTWAEYLSLQTGRAVILFPIAFHMNRTPGTWYNPRLTFPWVAKRKEKIANLSNSTFVNVALSTRLSDSPLRFYTSGRESLFNLWQLFSEIKEGDHPLFKKNTSIQIFAYSIGALLAQIFAIANPDNLISDSRIFLFCGGSIFSRMDGNARDIMDQEAYRRVKDYFLNDFLKNTPTHRDLPPVFKEDFIERAFRAMLHPDVETSRRETFFSQAKERIRILTLKKDTVMPTIGVAEALGDSFRQIAEELDFPYSYNHQNPFPVNSSVNEEAVNLAFKNVFNRVASFLG